MSVTTRPRNKYKAEAEARAKAKADAKAITEATSEAKAKKSEAKAKAEAQLGLERKANTKAAAIIGSSAQCPYQMRDSRGRKNSACTQGDSIHVN